jgi:hypothetical protein
MQGTTGSYAVNGVTLTLQPTQGSWGAKDIIGRDGNGKAIYPALGDYTLSWGLVSTSEMKQLLDFYDTVSNTGTCVVDLPEWGRADYSFLSYSGTYLSRPTVGAYFEHYVTEVSLLITSIRVK